MHQAEALCKLCNPEEITKLEHVKTILNRIDEIKIFQCPRCHKEFHEFQIIWSNYTWLYVEELGEWD